jgi:hypothetical protein
MLNFLHSYCLPYVVIIFAILSSTFAQTGRVNLKQNYPVLKVDNLLWIGTPDGLYQYNPSEEAFTQNKIPSPHLNPRVKQLYFYNDWLWCVLDTGIAALQVRLNDWLYFDSANGLPSNCVNSIDFQDDFVWIATDNGSAKFDLLIEQWELIDPKHQNFFEKVKDVEILNQQAWLIGERGFSEYDPRFEKWRRFELENKSEIIASSFKLRNELWLVTNLGMIRFNTLTQKRQLYDQPFLNEKNIIDIFTENEKLYVVSEVGVFYFDLQSEVWKEFEGNNNLTNQKITNGYISSAQLWILSLQNILVWDFKTKSWEILDYSSGLSSINYQSVFSDGDFSVLLKESNLDYRKTKTSPWKKFVFSIGEDNISKNILKNLFDNEEGGRVDIGDYKLTLKGTRISYLQELKNKYQPGSRDMGWKDKSNSRIDFKSQLDLLKGRRLTGFYNNVDYSETMYGVRYRGNDSDYIREINWGDFSLEAGSNSLEQSAEIFGTNEWFQYGDKTAKYKRSLLSAKVLNGEIRSKKNYENFQGATDKFNVTIRDVDFAKYQFYSIPDLETNSTPYDIEVYTSENYLLLEPNPNTLKNYTIAGVTANFNKKKEVEDYYYYNQYKVLYIPSWQPALIAIRYKQNGKVFEKILQSQTNQSNVKQNYYNLKAQQIIPYSLQLSIVDSLGNIIPLKNFGLDNDNDGVVDSRYIDYEKGLLIFPQDKPFLLEVYNNISPKSYYKFLVSYQTEMSIIRLQNQNLVRGSEKLWLDGTLASGGNDYVLDYTNGTLIFVREGLVSSYTRIEIEYEFYSQTQPDIYAATLNFSPTDNFYLQGEYQKTTDDSVNIFSLQSEIRYSISGLDFKLTPSASYQVNNNSLSTIGFHCLISSSRFRFQTDYQNYSKDYNNLYKQQSVFGELKSSLKFFSSFDVSDDLRLTGELKNSEGYNYQNSKVPNDQSLNATVLFNNKELPGIQFSFYKNKSELYNFQSRKYFYQSLIDYQIPASLTEKIFIQTLRLENYIKIGTQDEVTTITQSKQRFFNSYYKINSTFTDQFQVGFYYRNNKLYNSSLLSNSERLLGDITFSQIRATQLNLRLENNLQTYPHLSSSNRNYYMRQYYQINVRLIPGQVWNKLSSLFFEVNLNQSLNQLGVKDGNTSLYLWKITLPTTLYSTGYNLNRNYYIKNEFRPSSQLFLFSMFEWNNQEIAISQSKIEKSSFRLSEKLDVKLSFDTRLITQFKHFNQDLGFDRVMKDYEPSIWIEHRWNQDIINTINLLYRRRNDKDGKIINRSNDYESMFDFIYQKNNILGMRYVELRQSLSANFSETFGTIHLENYQVSVSTSIDLYPIHSLIIRIRMDWTKYWDQISNVNDYSTIAFSLRTSLQL